MGKIAIIFNPHAKRNRHRPEHCDILAEIVGDKGVIRRTQDLDELDEVSRELLGEDLDLIGICGGDGTNHLVVSSLISMFEQAGRALPPIALLKGGSMNTISSSVGVRTSAAKTLAYLSEQHRAGEPFKTKPLGTIRVNQQYGMFFGNGYAVNFLDEYYNTNSDAGPKRAAEITGRTISSILTHGEMFKRLAGKYQARVSVDGEDLAFPAYGMVLAGTIEHIGIGFKPLYRAREREGSFHTIVSSLTLGKVLAQAHRFYMGKPLSGEWHEDRVAGEVIVIGDEEIGYTIDGELYRAREVHINSGPTIQVALC